MAELYRRSELVDQGLTRRALERALRAGSLVRVMPGWYATSDIEGPELVAARIGGAVTCISEARSLGLWIPPGADERTHVVIHSSGHAGRHRGVRIHWRRSDWTRTGAVQRLHDDPLEALRTLCRCQPMETAFVIVESAIASGRIDLAAWRWILSRLPRHRAIALSAAGAESGSGTESAFVFRMRKLGVRVVQQVAIGPDRVDVLLPRRLIIELDSRRYHDHITDARRDARTGAAGFQTLRFVYEQVWFEWPTVQEAVFAALRRLG
jgi:very-short-patch-repair endonuclease